MPLVADAPAAAVAVASQWPLRYSVLSRYRGGWPGEEGTCTAVNLLKYHICSLMPQLHEMITDDGNRQEKVS